MQTIFKFEAPLPEGELAVKGFKKMISAVNQHDVIMLYALVDDNEKKVTKVHVSVVGTGKNADVAEDHDFIDTVPVMGGLFIWHVYAKVLKDA